MPQGAMVKVADKSQLFNDKSASSLAWLTRECTQGFGATAICLVWLLSRLSSVQASFPPQQTELGGLSDSRSGELRH